MTIIKCTVILPSEKAYPVLNAAADELLRELGPAFTGTSDGIQTGIAAAASLAGSVLLREAGTEVEICPADRFDPADSQSRQLDLLIFMSDIAPQIDPQIERGMGLHDGSWGADVPSEHSPLMDAVTGIGKLQTLPESVAAQQDFPPVLHAHIPALAAMKLVSLGHRLGLLDQKAGKALARYYLAAGSKQEDVLKDRFRAMSGREKR